VPRGVGAEFACALCAIERDSAAHRPSVREARASRTHP
jgi:hypothetical protein